MLSASLLLAVDAPPSPSEQPQGYFVAAVATITAFGLLYAAVTKGRTTARYRREVAIALGAIFVFLVLVAAVLEIRQQRTDEKSKATTTAESTETEPADDPEQLTKYRQDVVSVCDDLEAVDAARAEAEAAGDSTALMASWIKYADAGMAFTALEVPSSLAEDHAEATAVWRRHVRVLAALSDRLEATRTAEAVARILRSEQGKQSVQRRRELGVRLTDLGGTSCRYLPGR